MYLSLQQPILVSLILASHHYPLVLGPLSLPSVLFPPSITQSLIHAFRLIISLWMVGGEPISLNVKPFEKMSSEVEDKLRSAV